ncbi:hypothetical protein [uncultured Jatrophihabitans sp.]|uniref:hypothetical protein n=1 Tax=uncultured Jatrophihabitans sp. TaxID=1610747 RepID=UPI0035C9CDB3
MASLPARPVAHDIDEWRPSTGGLLTTDPATALLAKITSKIKHYAMSKDLTADSGRGCGF